MVQRRSRTPDGQTGLNLIICFTSILSEEGRAPVKLWFLIKTLKYRSWFWIWYSFKIFFLSSVVSSIINASNIVLRMNSNETKPRTEMIFTSYIEHFFLVIKLRKALHQSVILELYEVKVVALWPISVLILTFV